MSGDAARPRRAPLARRRPAPKRLRRYRDRAAVYRRRSGRRKVAASGLADALIRHGGGAAGAGKTAGDRTQIVVADLARSFRRLLALVELRIRLGLLNRHEDLLAIVGVHD